MATYVLQDTDRKGKSADVSRKFVPENDCLKEMRSALIESILEKMRNKAQDSLTQFKYAIFFALERDRNIVSEWKDIDGLNILHYCIAYQRPGILLLLHAIPGLFPLDKQPDISPYAHLAATIGAEYCLAIILTLRPQDFFEAVLPNHIVKIPRNARFMDSNRSNLSFALRPNHLKIPELSELRKRISLVTDLINESLALKMTQNFHQPKSSSYLDDVKNFIGENMDLFEKFSLYNKENLCSQENSHSPTTSPFILGIPSNTSRRLFLHGITSSFEASSSSLTTNHSRKENRAQTIANYPSSNKSSKVSILDSVKRNPRQPSISSEYEPFTRPRLRTLIDDIKTFQPEMLKNSNRNCLETSKKSTNTVRLDPITVSKSKYTPDMKGRNAPKRHQKNGYDSDSIEMELDCLSVLNRTPLDLAAEKRNIECVTTILSLRTLVNNPLLYQKGFLSLATEEDSKAAVEWIAHMSTKQQLISALDVSIQHYKHRCLSTLIKEMNSRGIYGKLKTQNLLFAVLKAGTTNSLQALENLPVMVQTILELHGDIRYDVMQPAINSTIVCAFKTDVPAKFNMYMECLKILMQNPAIQGKRSTRVPKGSRCSLIDRRQYNSAFDSAFITTKTAILNGGDESVLTAKLRKITNIIVTNLPNSQKKAMSKSYVLFEYFKHSPVLVVDKQILKSLLDIGVDPNIERQNMYALNVFYDSLLPNIEPRKSKNPLERYMSDIDAVITMCERMTYKSLKKAFSSFLSSYVLYNKVFAVHLVRYSCYLINNVLKKRKHHEATVRANQFATTWKNSIRSKDSR